jgi:hypothetical protein
VPTVYLGSNGRRHKFRLTDSAPILPPGPKTMSTRGWEVFWELPPNCSRQGHRLGCFGSVGRPSLKIGPSSHTCAPKTPVPIFLIHRNAKFDMILHMKSQIRNSIDYMPNLSSCIGASPEHQITANKWLQKGTTEARRVLKWTTPPPPPPPPPPSLAAPPTAPLHPTGAECGGACSDPP